MLCLGLNSRLEGALSQWTSYQEDVRQFVSWMETVEETLNSADKQCSEMRDKTANLGKAKVWCYCQCFESLSNCILVVVTPDILYKHSHSHSVAPRGCFKSQQRLGCHIHEGIQHGRALCHPARDSRLARALQYCQR